MLGGGEIKRIFSPIVDIAKPVPILEGLCNVFPKIKQQECKPFKYHQPKKSNNNNNNTRQHQSGEFNWESLTIN